MEFFLRGSKKEAFHLFRIIFTGTAINIYIDNVLDDYFFVRLLFHAIVGDASTAIEVGMGIL